MKQEDRESTIPLDDVDVILEERKKIEESLVGGSSPEDIVEQLIAKYKEEGKSPEEIEAASQQLLMEIISRIMKETVLAKEFEGIVDLEKLADFKQFIKDNDVIVEKDMGEVRGSYAMETQELKIDEKLLPSSPFVTISEIAKTGLPENMSALYHEIIHSLEIPITYAQKVGLNVVEVFMKYIQSLTNLTVVAGQPEFFALTAGLTTLFSILKFQKARKWDLQDRSVLTEVHAHHNLRLSTPKTEDSSDSERNDVLEGLESGTAIGMIQRLGHGYGYTGSNRIDQIAYAYQAIDRLRMLGLNHGQISELVEKSKWNYKNKAYDTLETEIEKLTEEKGIDPLDLDTAADIERMKLKNEVMKMRLIAQEELTKASEEAGVDVSEEFTERLLAA